MGGQDAVAAEDHRDLARVMADSSLASHLQHCALINDGMSVWHNRTDMREMTE